MKNRYSKLLAVVLSAGLCLGIAGCGASEETSVYLDYGTGIDEDGNYNDELYGINGNDVKGADPGAFWLSEEEDPVYGGYYYMYTTGWTVESATTLNSAYCVENNVAALAFRCYRSKDLYQWERCGSLDSGYSLQVDDEDWCRDKFWAPEVIQNPSDGKYYMYFSAASTQDYGVSSMSSSTNVQDRIYLCVAVADNPTGPFDILYDTDAETGKRVPTINFHTGCNTQYDWAAIDPSAYYDDDGQLYLYFKKEVDTNYSEISGAFGMKMLDMTRPDYSTVVCLSQPNSVTASSTPGQIEEVTESGSYFFDESNTNEGPFMLKHNGKYYLTYSANGYTSQKYSVHQAVGDSPLGTFTKLDASEGNPVLDGSELGYMVGTAHHCFVQRDGEIFALYHRHDTVFDYATGRGRSIAGDRAVWTTNSDGLNILAINGPSKSLQWLSENVSGYKNLAQTADVGISTGTGGKYLVDGLIPFSSTLADHVVQTESGDLTVTFRWDEPVSVTSLMIYNAKDVNYAFSKIADIRLKLAEKPEWADEDFTYAVIQDLEFPSRYWDSDSEEYIAGSPAVAEFDEIMVSEITITIEEGDRLMKEDKFGETNTALNLSEIVILGGKE